MIRSFRNQGTEDVFNGPPDVVRVARRKLGMIDAAVTLRDLRSPPNNKLEKLKEDREGQHAIRINEKYRVCFVWEDGADDVEVTDYH